MSLFGKLFMFLFAGAFALSLIACPPSQQEPAVEEETVVEEIEQAPGEVVEEVEEMVEEVPADDSAPADDGAADDTDDSGDATEPDDSTDDAGDETGSN